MSVTMMDSQERHYLFQYISVAVQRGNAASVLGTAKKTVKTLTAKFADVGIVIIILYYY